MIRIRCSTGSAQTKTKKSGKLKRQGVDIQGNSKCGEPTENTCG